jgi:hypothetical protein
MPCAWPFSGSAQWRMKRQQTLGDGLLGTILFTYQCLLGFNFCSAFTEVAVHQPVSLEFVIMFG